jgi:putative addiction module component (TIGR02574 family)
MAIDKNQIMQLDNEEKRNFAFELLDSIDEEFIKEPLPDWKRKLIEERLAAHKNNPNAVTPWSEIRKKYFGE